eukprot:TRINITY_DN1265_c0_g1_i1.p1 TRINITY_DN1265_c0_g1~~TRINITY_DN1265_c0_g1_i1.p1  ORF type:complete len:155 (+),score=46.74 TRINITY_DN1265_c0_g1_i1:49-465(+)
MPSPINLVSEREEDGKPVFDGEEELLATFPSCTLFFDPSKSEGVGTVYITSRNFYWLSAENSELGYSVAFPSIMIHAVCSDPEAFPHTCLYCQLDTDEVMEDDEEEGEEGEEEPMPASGETTAQTASEIPETAKAHRG